MWATMIDTRLASAHRMLDQLAVLADLPETAAGSRAQLREARGLLKHLLKLVPTGGVYRKRAVAAKVLRLTEMQKVETQRGARATLRRTAQALADASDLVDEANVTRSRA